MASTARCELRRLNGGALLQIVSPAPRGGACGSLHAELDCATAADFRHSTRYKLLSACVCCESALEGQQRCARHWFTPLATLVARDQQPVGMAHSEEQLAAVLGVAQVELLHRATPAPPAAAAGAAAASGGRSQPQPVQPAQRAQQPTQARQPAGMRPRAVASAHAAADDGGVAPMAVDQPADAAARLQRGPQQQPQPQPRPRQVQQPPPPPVLHLTLGRPLGNWRHAPCSGVIVVVSGDALQRARGAARAPAGPVHARRCGNEAGHHGFCRFHAGSAVDVVSREGARLASLDTLPALAAALGYSGVEVADAHGGLALHGGPATPPPVQPQPHPAAAAAGERATAVQRAAAAAAAAAASPPPRRGRRDSSVERHSSKHSSSSKRSKDRTERRRSGGPSGGSSGGSSPTGRGQKRSSAEAELPEPVAKLQASAWEQGPQDGKQDNQQQRRRQQAKPADAAPDAGADAVLQLTLAPEHVQAALDATRAALAELPAAARSQLQQQEVQLQQGQLQLTLHGRLDSGSIDTRCLGLTLRLDVADAQELLASSGPVRVLSGTRCGAEGGAKRCCRHHRNLLCLLTTATNEPLPGANDLATLAIRLNVLRVQLLEPASLRPLPHYASLPLLPSWRRAPSRSTLELLLPRHEARTGKGCAGLDLTVLLPRDAKHQLGSPLPLLGLSRCSNLAGSNLACRRHLSGGLLHLYRCDTPSALGAGGAQGTLLHTCGTLGELAIWLGVDKVVALDADTQEPLRIYSSLVGAPQQLPLVGPRHTPPPLAPPSLMLLRGDGGGAGGVDGGSAGAATGSGSSTPAAAQAAAAAGGASASPSARTPAMERSPDAAPLRGVAAMLGGRPVAGGGGGGGGASPTPSSQAAGPSSGGATATAEAATGGAGAAPAPAEQRAAGGAAGAGSSEPGRPGLGNSWMEVAEHGGIVVRVEPTPRGPHVNVKCCRALDVLLLLPDGQAYEPGQQHQVLGVSRCANQCGHKTRCRVHTDAPLSVRVLSAADAQPGQLLTASSWSPSNWGSATAAACALLQRATVVGKAATSEQAAKLLGAPRLELRSKGGEQLGDLAVWSASDYTGAAAKLSASSGLPPAHSVLASLMAGGSGGPGVTLPAPPAPVQRIQVGPRRTPNTQQPATTAAAGAAAGAPAGGAAASAPAAAHTTPPHLAVSRLSLSTSSAGLERSSPATAMLPPVSLAALGGSSGGAGGLTMVLQSSGIAASIAAGGCGAAAVPAPTHTEAAAAGQEAGSAATSAAGRLTAPLPVAAALAGPATAPAATAELAAVGLCAAQVDGAAAPGPAAAPADTPAPAPAGPEAAEAAEQPPAASEASAPGFVTSAPAALARWAAVFSAT